MYITLGLIFFLGVIIAFQLFSGFFMIREAIRESIGCIGIFFGALMLTTLTLSVPLEVCLIIEFLKYL